jgi:demethylmenaquinone methyltransferase/2-methoxy-6-polyprenyl-1,4-benzoquinol methylase
LGEARPRVGFTGSAGGPRTERKRHALELFAGLPRHYDRVAAVLSFGQDPRWRRAMVDAIAAMPADRVLDVATGTGDLAMELARRVAPRGEVIGSDFSENMLELARAKAPDLRFEWGNALDLEYPDDSFDAATVGFGARNFSDLPAGLSEMTRVVRPGGRVVVLEITTPQRPPLSWFFGLWFDRVIPMLGRLAGDPDAYSYLPNSVRRFPGPRELAAELVAVGLVDVRWLLTAGGIIAIHVGRRP